LSGYLACIAVFRRKDLETFGNRASASWSLDSDASEFEKIESVSMRGLLTLPILAKYS
jgi:hypothetical protein